MILAANQPTRRLRRLVEASLLAYPHHFARLDRSQRCSGFEDSVDREYFDRP